MNQRLIRLAERREVLVAQASAQRRTLARSLEPWRRPLTLAGQGLAALQFVRNHPVWVVGSAVLPAALQPGRVGTWLRRGLVVFQVLRQLRPRVPPDEANR